jgi:trk system potassium uptake protein TrkA
VRIIVVGAGEVGSYVADRLSREGHDVAVIERDNDVIRHLEEGLDVHTVHGSGTSPSVLAEAGADKADLLVAVTSDDETNLICSLIAKQIGVPQIIVRLESRELRSMDARDLHAAIGVDLVIDPDQETAEEIIELLDYPGVSEIAEMGQGEIVVIGARLPAHAPLVGRTLQEVAMDYEPQWDFLFGAITRGDQTIIPRGNQTLEAGDLLRVVKLLGLARTAPRRVMLLGGGRTAEIVATKLSERGAEVVIVERDHARAQDLAEGLPRALILEGEITDADLLTDERVGDFDAVIALTGEDDANILACLFAKSAGTIETIAVVHRLSLLPLLQDIGIDVALSPRTASANGVLRFVRGGVAAVATFLQGEAEVLELEVKEGSPADGAIVAELRLPRDVLVGARVRDGKAEIVRGRSQLRDRDHVVLFAVPEEVDELRRIFG